MSDDELKKLASDIAENDQQEPIVLFNGQVLDGRNRLAACKLLGIEAKSRVLRDCVSPTAYVLSANLHRRHLTTIQRATIGNEAKPLYAAEAKARQLAGAKTGGETAGKGRPKQPHPPKGGKANAPHQGEATRQAAAAVGVGHRAVEAMAAVKRDAPEVYELAQGTGRIRTVAEAQRLVALPEPQRSKVLQIIRRGEPAAKALREVAREEDAADRATRCFKQIETAIRKIAGELEKLQSMFDSLPTETQRRVRRLGELTDKLTKVVS